MTDTAIIYDCEFLTAPGAPQRFWCGPNDPDPIAVQIGAVQLALTPEAEILDTFEQVIRPMGRDGEQAAIHPFFTKLTGISEARIARENVSLGEALAALEDFSAGAPLWCWGKDEFNLLAISCYVAGITPTIPARRFGNATRLFQAAGIPDDTIQGLRSPGLPAFLGLDDAGLPAHDALGDAKAVALALQHLIRQGQLDPETLADPTYSRGDTP